MSHRFIKNSTGKIYTEKDRSLSSSKRGMFCKKCCRTYLRINSCLDTYTGVTNSHLYMLEADAEALRASMVSGSDSYTFHYPPAPDGAAGPEQCFYIIARGSSSPYRQTFKPFTLANDPFAIVIKPDFSRDELSGTTNPDGTDGYCHNWCYCYSCGNCPESVRPCAFKVTFADTAPYGCLFYSATGQTYSVTGDLNGEFVVPIGQILGAGLGISVACWYELTLTGDDSPLTFNVWGGASCSGTPSTSKTMTILVAPSSTVTSGVWSSVTWQVEVIMGSPGEIVWQSSTGTSACCVSTVTATSDYPNTSGGVTNHKWIEGGTVTIQPADGDPYASATCSGSSAPCTCPDGLASSYVVNFDYYPVVGSPCLGQSVTVSLFTLCTYRTSSVLSGCLAGKTVKLILNDAVTPCAWEVGIDEESPNCSKTTGADPTGAYTDSDRLKNVSVS